MLILRPPRPERFEEKALYRILQVKSEGESRVEPQRSRKVPEVLFELLTLPSLPIHSSLDGRKRSIWSTRRSELVMLTIAFQIDWSGRYQLRPYFPSNPPQTSSHSMLSALGELYGKSRLRELRPYDH